MKAVILLFLLFGYVNAVADCDEGCEDGGTCPESCSGIENCAPKADDADYCEYTAPETTEPPCIEDRDMREWGVEYIGKSTQWRIYDPCNSKFIKFKMESLTEYEADGKKTVNKETSFASTKDWEPKAENFEATADVLVNTFVADQLSKTGAYFKLETQFFRREKSIIDPDDTSDTPANITVDRNSFKFTVDIGDWPMMADGNYLELCINVMTNEAGKFSSVNDDTKVIENGRFTFENSNVAYCGDRAAHDAGTADATTVTLPEEIPGNGNNHLDFCYQFESCPGGNIYYDPILSIEAAANSKSVFVVIIVAIMSLFFV